MKIRHMNPNLAELNLESYNSIPELLVKMTRLNRLATTQAKQASYIAATQAQKKEQE